MALQISRSVGRKGVNLDPDVRIIQSLINANIGQLVPLAPLVEDGDNGPKTEGAISEFQSRIVKMNQPDARVDPGGKTLRTLNEGVTSIPPTPVSDSVYFSHPGADQVTLTYGAKARKLTATAEHLLKSILIASGNTRATLTSTRRTYHDQARITMTQTYPNRGAGTVRTWYGQTVLDKCIHYRQTNDIQGFADWWEQYDANRGRVSSKHLTNQAMDVVPGQDRLKFVAKVQELVPVKGSGVLRIIPKGVLNEPVDHVEFTFKVCPN